jgi:flagellar motor protein MotB
MKSHYFAALFACALFAAPFVSQSFAQEPAKENKPTPTEQATAAAEKWLALVDTEKYDESWDESASLFRAALTKEAWGKMLTASRGSFGKLISRKVKSAEFHTQLPGAPDGEYVVIQFETSFEKKKESIETVTPMKDKDGNWRVSGYFIK